jgi:rSAM/selenodomain-associated transferase 1
MAKPVVILFAKAPRLGQVKRRLAAGIGDVAALRFYRNQLAGMVRMLRGLRGFDACIAISPDRARFLPAPGLPVLNQGSGGLGARMARAFRRFPRRPAILIGSDIPGLKATHLRAARRALQHHDAAFGPAFDGGYYLVAMGRNRPSKPFAGTRWSGPETLADTLVNFRHHRLALLPVLQDVDTAADLDALNNTALRRAPKHR